MAELFYLPPGRGEAIKLLFVPALPEYLPLVNEIAHNGVEVHPPTPNVVRF